MDPLTMMAAGQMGQQAGGKAGKGDGDRAMDAVGQTANAAMDGVGKAAGHAADLNGKAMQAMSKVSSVATESSAGAAASSMGTDIKAADALRSAIL